MENTIYPCLWFNGNAGEAARFYCSVFKNSRILSDTPLVVTFELNGNKFMGLNGGPQFAPNPSISFFAVVDTEEEADNAWQRLQENGNVLMPLDKYEWSEKYGWVQDRFGVSWQINFGNIEDVGQRFSPCLLFTKPKAGKAEEAIAFYTTIFKNSTVAGILKYASGDHDIEGLVKHAQFTLDGHIFMAMDSTTADPFPFTEGISFVVECSNQQQIDHFWNTFTDTGEESRCGWLKDKFGVSWQIIPNNIEELMNHPQKAPQVMNAILEMKKIDMERLKHVYEHG